MTRKENRLLQEHIAALGNDFGSVYHAVWYEWVTGLLRYREIQEMFGDEEKCALLNAVAKGFFADVQQLFWSDLMLHVTRLTDKPKRALRIQSLERFLKDEPKVLEQVMKHRKAAVIVAEPVKDWRNKRIAHRSLSRTLDISPSPLAQVKLNACKKVLDHAHAALQIISRHYMDSSIENTVFYRPHSGRLTAYFKGLVESVCFIDSVIDPDRPGSFDLEKGRMFLRKMGRSEVGDSCRLFDLMDLARRLRAE